MVSNTTGKKYYLRHAGRITGPYSMLRLTAMLNRGSLSCEDMFSEDKRSWNYVDLLFPALTPGKPIAVIPDGPPPVPAADLSGKADAAAYGNDALPVFPDKSSFGEHSLNEWIIDIGRTMALLWDFREILHGPAEKSGRYYGIAAVIHILLCTGIIILFGKYYSQRFDCFFSPLMGLSLLAVLWAVSSLTGWLAARYTTPAGRHVVPTWKICAAGIFMNYGILACSFLALAHGIQHLWVQAVLVFIDSFVLCSSAMQLRDYLEAGGKSWKGPVLSVVFLLNPVLVSVICWFKTLI